MADVDETELGGLRTVREVIISPRREHSRKPDEAIARIERFCPGPRVELFAGEKRRERIVGETSKNAQDCSLLRTGMPTRLAHDRQVHARVWCEEPSALGPACIVE
jgi:hypothetical protein